MRSGQQNKRGRGRSSNNSSNNSNNGRKGGNPLSRTYDSNGPDVKIRGTAQHIADKYATMARDSNGSGDPVMAENYLQHAEHYYRIIATAQAQIQERFQREERENPEREREQQPDDNANAATQGSDNKPAENVMDGSGPQPVIDGTPAEISMEEEGAEQPARRSPVRRRAPARPRRPRAASPAQTEGAAAESEGTVAKTEGAAESKAAPVRETRKRKSETQDHPAEVAVVAPEV